MSHSKRVLATFIALCFPIIIIGCDDEPPKKAKAKTRETIGKYTQEVRDLQAELSKGATTTDGKIHATDYITLQADAYRTSVANIAKMRVQADMNIYETMNDTKVKTYEEFMDQIIKKGKPDGIMLPMLPYYQEYGYDAEKRELVVLEYPAKRKELDAQWDKDLGR